MANGKARSVSVVFQAFTDKFQSKTKAAGTSMSGFAKKASLMAAGAAVIGTAFTAARSAVRQLTEQFKKLDTLGKLSDSLEVSPDFLQGLDLAATQTGSSFATAQKALSKFVRSVGEAKAGTGEGIQGLEILGVQLEDIENLNVEEQFLKIAESIKAMEDPNLKAAAAAKLFGRSGQDMINLFNQGEEGLKSFIAQQKELSGGISRDDIKRVEEANDAIDKMKRSWEGIVQQVAVRLGPAITVISNAITVLVKKMQKIIDKFSKLTGLAKVLGIIDDLNGQGDSKSKPRNNISAIPPLKIATQSIKSFSEAIAAGSSAAFNALNPNSTNSVANQTLEESKQQTSLLNKIANKGRTTFKQVTS
tara:strand:+ start:593 stop:1678 length:1086 start_codon:yes stop_codon:yes gene_type:complete